MLERRGEGIKGWTERQKNKTREYEVARMQNNIQVNKNKLDKRGKRETELPERRKLNEERQKRKR